MKPMLWLCFGPETDYNGYDKTGLGIFCDPLDPL